MYKHSNDEWLVNVVSEMLDSLLNHHVFIDELNTGLLTVIIKDSKGPTDSINIRPITLSNVIDIIFETYMNVHLNLAIKTHDLQFGFSEFTSCAHAVFLFKEVCYYKLKMREKLFASIIF